VRVVVEIGRRPGIADPEGTTVARALRDLGFDDVEGVALGRTITLTLAGTDPGAAEEAVRAMCEKLLANPVIEDYTVRVVDE
jgi:phosphoribosylformylglycinamidine synthase